MPNIKKNTKLMTTRLKMLGIAEINVYTASFNPSFLDITLNGLKTLINLNTLKIFSFLLLTIIDINENTTIIKSNKFQ